MKKYLKAALNIVLSFLVMLSTIISTSVISNATESTVSNQAMTFIPFRSDLVKYVTNNSSSKGQVIQSQWFRLFREETSTPGWSNKYYSDYTGSDGITRSSRGITVTYNPQFDPFLYGTIISNQDFVSNWINYSPYIFEGYANDFKNHPVFCNGIIELTKNGYMLGNGYRQANNVFEYGFAQKDFWDLKVLAILASNWNTISINQQNWCKTYLPYLVNDYVNRGANAIAAKNNNPALYDLMAISNEGFFSPKGQEFFNHCISEPTVKIGDLIKNIMSSNGQAGSIRNGIIYNETDMNSIFAGDGDCDYNSMTLGDGDYDWFAYNLCFSGDGTYSRLRNFVDGNGATALLKKDWLLRYYAKHGSNNGSSDISDAIAKQGQTVSQACSSALVKGCNRSCRNSNQSSFYCGTHTGTSEGVLIKPVGVSQISFSGNLSAKYKWQIIDNSTGTIISQNMENYSSSPKIDIDPEYIWSSTISVRVITHYQFGYGRQVGRGDCYDSKGTTSVNWTYVALSNCEVNGHSYAYNYSFAHDHSSCTAHGTCIYCGNQTSFTDNNIVKSQDANFYYYTAQFSTVPVNAKSDSVAKTKGEFIYRSDNKSAISGQTENKDEVSKRCTGEGFILKTRTSATCSLASGNIMPGAKSVTVCASGNEVTYSLCNKQGVVLSTITLNSPNQGEINHTFNTARYSDSQLEGAYVVVNMYSESTFASGMYVGQIANCSSKVKFNYIQIKY